MLVLTRRSGEAIVIGGDIRIRVLRAGGSRVRLGIEAPADVRIIREKAEPAADTEEPVPFATHPPRHVRDGVARNVAASPRAARQETPTVLAERQTTLD